MIADRDDRMPVILTPALEKVWLQPDGSVHLLCALLEPLPADDLVMYPISPRVNSVRADDPDLLTPVHLLVDPNR